VRALARCARLEGLKGLGLHGNYYGPAGVSAWRVSPFINQLLPPIHRSW